MRMELASVYLRVQILGHYVYLMIFSRFLFNFSCLIFLIDDRKCQFHVEYNYNVSVHLRVQILARYFWVCS